MKKISLLIFVLLNSIILGQSNCNFTYTPTEIFYPNSSYTPTTSSTASDIQYLCGPNTVVYDTIVHSCYIYVNANCTLTIKPNCGYCPATINVWLKNNSVLNIVTGNCSLLNVIKEPLATINNTNSVMYTSNTCSAMSFPTVNCSATGIKSFENESDRVSLYPNPVNETLQLNYENFSDNDNYKIGIYNSIGQLIKEEELTFKNQTATINTKDLQNGVYVLKLSFRGTRDLSSDPSYRQDDNQITLSKRFVIAR